MADQVQLSVEFLQKYWPVAQAVINIIRRHFQATGEILTTADVKRMLEVELADGQNTISRWFAEQGLPQPDSAEAAERRLVAPSKTKVPGLVENPDPTVVEPKPQS